MSCAMSMIGRKKKKQYVDREKNDDGDREQTTTNRASERAV